MCGISGSGKSTYALAYQLVNGCEVVSSDDIRAEYGITTFTNSDNQKVFSIAKDRVVNLLSQGHDVILDATNVSVKDRKGALKWVKDLPDVFKRCVVMQVSESTCINRQNDRGRKVPINVIERQSSRFVMPTYDEGFDEILVFRADGTAYMV